MSLKIPVVLKVGLTGWTADPWSFWDPGCLESALPGFVDSPAPGFALSCAAVEAQRKHARKIAAIQESPKYKKCEILKNLHERKAQRKELQDGLKTAQEDIKVVGYTTLGTQSSINNFKRIIHNLDNNTLKIKKELGAYGHIKVTDQECNSLLENNRW